MITFNTAIWKSDLWKVNKLYQEKGWGNPDIYAGDDETQPITVTPTQFEAIKAIPIEVGVITPGPR